MRTDAFDYDLPPERIAQKPVECRSASRMLLLDRRTGSLQARMFTDFSTCLRHGDLVVFNNTRVLRSRLFGIKENGGAKIELLLVRKTGEEWLCMARPGKRMTKSARIRILDRNGDNSAFVVDVLGRTDEGIFRIRVATDENESRDICDVCGHVPLPPYVRRPDTDEDSQQYQTVYATVPGAVAAPTAGLHFDAETLEHLRSRKIATTEVTLHVGPGTFQPVSSEFIDGHRMHEEEYCVSPEAAEAISTTRANGGRIVAVGTTVVRVLESIADEAGKISAGSGSTRIFIYPPYRFRCVDCLFTNFHLPKSTLLMLVCAFAGQKRTLDAYRFAIENQFRFYSYGDCMLIL
jgi:S-adenosylmethionine:tRNA ribosyltransferase-isomerase